MKKAVLFDLDGTLLPMDNDEFTRVYIGLLARKAAGWGYEPEEMVKALWKGTGAMVKNDGSRPNEEAFWSVFKANVTSRTPEQIEGDKPLFDRFYTEEFHGAKSTTGDNPEAARLLVRLRGLGLRLILATNPLFPPQAIETRLGWIGLKPDDFEYITTYDNSSFCKPNPDYYREIMYKNGLSPEECVMVGNDIGEDMVPASSAGMDVVLSTDCLINPGGLPVEGFRPTSFGQLFEVIKSL